MDRIQANPVNPVQSSSRQRGARPQSRQAGIHTEGTLAEFLTGWFPKGE